MSEVDLTQQLDQAIDAMMATGGEVPASVDARIGDLLGIAVELRDLPRAEFKARLQNELEEQAVMSTATKQATKKINPVREGFRTITPYLVVPDVHAEVEFLTQALGADRARLWTGHAGWFSRRVQDRRVDHHGRRRRRGFGLEGNAFPGTIHLYVEDVDAVYRASAAGGRDVAVRSGGPAVRRSRLWRAGCRWQSMVSGARIWVVVMSRKACTT